MVKRPPKKKLQSGTVNCSDKCKDIFGCIESIVN